MFFHIYPPGAAVTDGAGTLYIVSTPIGNMDDLTPRAAACLRDAALIACEDTRRTGLLLSRLGIKRRLLSYRDANARRQAPVIVEHLARGEDVALVSDAGTPGVSDPAYRVVRGAIEAGCDVIAAPGASALLAALVVSGMPLDRFVFEGFPPQRGAKRGKYLESLAHEERTVIFYESPFRVIGLLEQLLALWGDREVSVSRELTKLHEETVRGPVSAVLEQLRAKKTRGEYTVVVRGRNAD